MRMKNMAQLYSVAIDCLSSRSLKMAGKVITDPSIRTYQDALILQAYLAYDLSKHNNPDQLLQWILSTYEADLGLLIAGLKRSIDIIRRYPSDCYDMTYSSFKDSTRIPRPGDFFYPVKEYVTSFLLNRDSLSMAVTLQWVSFITRLTLDFVDVDAEEEFIRNDNVLSELPESADQLREVFQQLVSSYHPENYDFQFSDGSNSDSPRKDGLIGKYATLLRGCTARQRYFLTQVGWGCPLVTRSAAHAKVVFVPKGIDKRRTICEEPAFNMFLQQGIWREIDKWMKKELSSFIRLHDSSYNTSAACSASKNLDCATIDLSAASDSVSWLLFKYIAQGSQYYRDVLCTRTSACLLPSGRKVDLKKVCPMGSALCFPTECLVFLAIVILSWQQVGGHRHLLKQIRVYGDDLIVPYEIENKVQYNLELFGFRINNSKTFLSWERFKESCGGEFFDGDEVTPLILSRKFSSFSTATPSHLANLIDLANRLALRGYRATRAAVIRELILSHYCPLFSDNHHEGLYSKQPTNFHCKERWNPDLQRYEIRIQRPCSEDFPALGIGDESIRYFECLRRLNVSERKRLLFPEDRIITSIGSSTSVLKWSWVAKPEFTNDEQNGVIEYDSIWDISLDSPF